MAERNGDPLADGCWKQVLHDELCVLRDGASRLLRACEFIAVSGQFRDFP